MGKVQLWEPCRKCGREPCYLDLNNLCIVCAKGFKLIHRDDKIYVFSKYDPNFPQIAKGMGGSWNAQEKAWVYDIAKEAEVLDVYKKRFGR